MRETQLIGFASCLEVMIARVTACFVFVSGMLIDLAVFAFIFQVQCGSVHRVYFQHFCDIHMGAAVRDTVHAWEQTACYA